MQEKTVEDYLNLLYPTREGLSQAEQMNLTFDQTFIAEHIGEIKAYYKANKKPDSYSVRNGMDEKSIMLMAIKDTKTSFYFSLLYPEYQNLPSNEKFYLMEDYMFISSHIDKIDDVYKTCQRPGIYAHDMGYSQQEIVSMAVYQSKIFYYFNMLHPEYDKLTPGEQLDLMSDQTFIAMHIKEIDEYYKSTIHSRRDNLNSREILRDIVDNIKISRVQ